MELIQPSYYNKFHCLAGACPDSCCQAWEVEIDPETAELYYRLPGELGEAIRQVMQTENDEIWLENSGERCPMWREDGLCRIQAALGEEALSKVCREFPRLRQDYGDFVELGLEMSCPEAARIMLEADSWCLEMQTLPGGDAPDYEAETMALLQCCRPYAFALLQNRQYTVNERLALLLMYAYHVQALLDGEDGSNFDLTAALKEARDFAAPGDSAALFDFYRNLEILTDPWRDLLHAGPQSPCWDEALCRFAQYGVYRFFYQAVSDWDLVGRMKMIVAGCVLCALLCGSGASQSVLQLYAKEIENDADNIDALLDGAYTEAALRDANLLGLLLK